MIEKINKICQIGVRVIGIFLVGYLFIQGLFTLCCIQQGSEKTYYIENNVLRQLFFIVLFCVFTIFLGKKKVQIFLKKYGNALVGITFLGMIIFIIFWISNTIFWPHDDMHKIFLNAESALSGDYSGWQAGGYMYMWPHQNGLLLLVAFLLSFMQVSTSFYVLYALNVLFYTITIGSLVYSIKNMYPHDETNCIQSLMLICYLPYSFFCLLLYGNVMGVGLASVAIVTMLLYLKKQKKHWLIWSAVFMSMAIVIKQNEMIIFIGLIILLIFDCINNSKDRKTKIVLSLLYVLIVTITISLPNYTIKQITQFETIGGNSKWAHLAMGSQESARAPGWYNNYNEKIFIDNNYDKELTANASKADLKQRWSQFADDPYSAWKFFNYKLASEWNNPTFECCTMQTSRGTSLELSSLVKSTINDGGKINILLILLFDIGQSVLLFGILLYLIAANKSNWEQLLFCILFIGGFVFFALWEAKCQYVLPFFFLLIPYSYLGYQELAKTITANKHGWNKLYTSVAVLVILIIFVGVSDAQWVKDSFKINDDTEAYYEYIHQYNKNFTNLRF